jgi:hypothetical protein
MYRRCRYSPVVRRGFRRRETRSRGRSLLSDPDIPAINDRQVFSGDQLNGQKTSYDSRSVSAKFTKPVIDRQIPWCAIFGNHDSEIADDRAEQMRALQSLPYSLAQPGPLACRLLIAARPYQTTLGRCVQSPYLYAILPRFRIVSKKDSTLDRRRLRLHQRVSLLSSTTDRGRRDG